MWRTKLHLKLEWILSVKNDSVPFSWAIKKFKKQIYLSHYRTVYNELVKTESGKMHFPSMLTISMNFHFPGSLMFSVSAVLMKVSGLAGGLIIFWWSRLLQAISVRICLLSKSYKGDGCDLRSCSGSKVCLWSQKTRTPEVSVPSGHKGSSSGNHAPVVLCQPQQSSPTGS